MQQGGILTGPAIREAIALGDIEIAPFVPENVNPNSVDLRLGPDVFVHRDTRVEPLDCKALPDGAFFSIPDTGLILVPGMLYLMHTLERVCSKKYVPVMDGKSSVGRLGIFTHVTAGYGDIGFDGQYTLEVVVVHPIRVYEGMRIAQMRFHTACGEIEDYTKRGNYVGSMATGPVPSQLYRQFKK